MALNNAFAASLQRRGTPKTRFKDAWYRHKTKDKRDNMAVTKSTSTVPATDVKKGGSKTAPKRKTETEVETGDCAVAAEPSAPAPTEPAKKRRASGKAAPAAAKTTASEQGAVSAPGNDENEENTVVVEDDSIDSTVAGDDDVGNMKTARGSGKLLIKKEEISDILTEFRNALKNELNAEGLAPQTKATVKRLRTSFTVMEKTISRFMRQKPPKRVRRVIDGVPRKSGLEVPRPISDGLCSFMSLDSGSEISRADVTKFISAYIRTNELQDPEARKNIIPDPAMRKLFALEHNEVVTFPGIQRLLKLREHFLPVPSPVQPDA